MSKWDDETRRDELRASAPDVPKHGRRKNTRRWCKGKVGVEHQLKIQLDERVASWRTHLGRKLPDCYRPDWAVTGKRRSRPASWSWFCSHVRICTVCGKIFDHQLGTNCPDYTPEVTVFSDAEVQKLKDATRAE